MFFCKNFFRSQNSSSYLFKTKKPEIKAFPAPCATCQTQKQQQHRGEKRKAAGPQAPPPPPFFLELSQF